MTPPLCVSAMNTSSLTEISWFKRHDWISFLKNQDQSNDQVMKNHVDILTYGTVKVQKPTWLKDKYSDILRQTDVIPKYA